MSTSKRQQILELFRTRLQAIQTTAGFQTNLGDKVFLGELPRLGPDDASHVIALAIGVDQVNPKQMEKVSLALPIDIYVVTTTEGLDPWSLVEAGIADVKQAVELENEGRFLGHLAIDRIVRGSTRTMERESGTPFIGAVITYVVPMTEVWGHPDQ